MYNFIFRLFIRQHTPFLHHIHQKIFHLLSAHMLRPKPLHHETLLEVRSLSGHAETAVAGFTKGIDRDTRTGKLHTSTGSLCTTQFKTTTLQTPCQETFGCSEGCKQLSSLPSRLSGFILVTRVQTRKGAHLGPVQAKGQLAQQQS